MDNVVRWALDKPLHLSVSGRERAGSCAPGDVATSAQCPAPEAPGAPAAPLGREMLHRDAESGGRGRRAAAAGGTTQRAQGNDGVMGKVAAVAV